MRGNEFIRRVQKYAKRNGISFAWRADRGKGSHGILTLGDTRTVIRNPKDELKTGAYHAMLKQLGITERDLS
jgi:mRNA interferase HicA